MRKGDIVECEILDLAFGGAGVAKVMEPAHDGMEEREFVVFIDKTVPGDLVKAEVIKRKRKYAEARVTELVKPSKLRIKPRCKYFGECGGCKLQFLDYEQQLGIKQTQVNDAIERIGGFRGFEIEKIIGCEEPWFYRNKMEFSFAWDRNPSDYFQSIENGRQVSEDEKPVISLGLHPAGRYFETIDIEECFLQSEKTVELLNKVREYVRNNSWEPYHFRLQRGFARSLFVREGKNTGEMMVNLTTSGKVHESIVKDFFEWLSKECSDLNSGLSSGYWLHVDAKRGQRTKIREKLMVGKETLREELTIESGEKLKFDILPQAFFQPNTKQAGVLYSQIFKFAGIDKESVVFDLFCGTGTIALFCALKAKEVYGIELNESAIENARANAQLNELKNVEFMVGDVGKMVGELKVKPDVIVMDPPRAGVGEKALAEILPFGAKQIVYVSCNPSTLARDLKFLSENGYEFKKLQPVDMFPQTGHIECVALLERS